MICVCIVSKKFLDWNGMLCSNSYFYIKFEQKRIHHETQKKRFFLHTKWQMKHDCVEFFSM